MNRQGSSKAGIKGMNVQWKLARSLTVALNTSYIQLRLRSFPRIWSGWLMERRELDEPPFAGHPDLLVPRYVLRSLRLGQAADRAQLGRRASSLSFAIFLRSYEGVTESCDASREEDNEGTRVTTSAKKSRTGQDVRSRWL